MNKLSLFTAFIALASIGFAADPTTVVNPDTALALLEKGNAAFIENPISKPQAVHDARISSIDSHTPIAVVVTCSDARTAPEHIFSKNLNRIFVVRTAGNVVDNIGLGSIEYAVKALGVRLIVVMGHQNCGAVKSTIAGGSIPPHINSIVNLIKPAVATARTEQGDLLSNSIQANAIRVADKIRHDSDLGDAAKDVKVVPSYYSLETGKFHWLK
jgi:carbonic anhydrase